MHLQEVYGRNWVCNLAMAMIIVKNFSCLVTYITFKKKASTCGSQVGHMWVTSGLFCGSVGQIGQQV